MTFNQYTYGATLLEHFLGKDVEVKAEAKKELLRRGFSEKELERMQDMYPNGLGHL